MPQSGMISSIGKINDVFSPVLIKIHEKSVKQEPCAPNAPDVYMIDFDTTMAKSAHDHKGLYMRYYNDLLIAIPGSGGCDAARTADALLDFVVGYPGITVQREKTSPFRYSAYRGS